MHRQTVGCPNDVGPTVVVPTMSNQTFSHLKLNFAGSGFAVDDARREPEVRDGVGDLIRQNLGRVKLDLGLCRHQRNPDVFDSCKNAQCAVI